MQPHVKHSVSVSTSTTLTCHKHCPYRRRHKSCLCKFPLNISTSVSIHPHFFKQCDGVPSDLDPLPRQSGHRPRHGQIGNERVSLPTNYSADRSAWHVAGRARLAGSASPRLPKTSPSPTFKGVAQSGAAGTVSFPTMKETFCSKNEAISNELQASTAVTSRSPKRTGY